jgi:phenol 2-monooxygenase (NADPH)
MNTGIHDAFNLAWKLSGYLKGIFKDPVLDTYEYERRASAQHLIRLDQDVASLITGKMPVHFNAPPNTDPNDYLGIIFKENAQFTVGIGISYDKNVVNCPPSMSADLHAVPDIKIGFRCPDVPLFRPGIPLPQHLRKYVRYNGLFWVLVFAGRAERTAGAVRLSQRCTEHYQTIRSYIDSQTSFTRTLSKDLNWLTIVWGEGSLQSAETLGALPIGKTLWDKSGEAYAKFGVREHQGGIVVLRPDSVVSFVAPLEGTSQLESYFRSIMQPQAEPSEVPKQHAPLNSIKPSGEVSVEGMEEFVRF